MTNIYSRWRLIITFIIVAITIFVDSQNVTVDSEANTTDSQNVTVVIDANTTVLGEPPKPVPTCTPLQIGGVYECMGKILEETQNWSNASGTNVVGVFSTLFGATSYQYSWTKSTLDNSWIFDASQLADHYEDSIKFLYEMGPTPERQKLMTSACVGVLKFSDCAAAVIGNSTCSPLLFRVNTALGQNLCGPGLIDTALQSAQCTHKLLSDPTIVECMNSTGSRENPFLEGADWASKGEKSCEVTENTIDCFKDSDLCSNSTMIASATLARRLVSSVFGFICTPIVKNLLLELEANNETLIV